jgi:predicted nucleic acid-binding Zn ribbon protein
MKKVTVEERHEEAEYTCDSCGAEAFGQLQIHFWYGSSMDMTHGAVHLCDKCALNAKSALNSVGINIKLEEIIDL